MNQPQQYPLTFLKDRAKTLAHEIEHVLQVVTSEVTRREEAGEEPIDNVWVSINCLIEIQNNLSLVCDPVREAIEEERQRMEERKAGVERELVGHRRGKPRDANR